MDFKESYYYYVIKMLLTVLHTKIGHINIWLYYVCVSRDFSPGHAGKEGPQLAMTGASCGFSPVGAQV